MGSRGLTTNMISAIDIALWDIRGKVLGLPISELFGGPVREGVPIYCHPQNGSSVKDTVQQVMASVPNHYRVETSRAKLNAYDVFIDHPLDIRADKIYLSDRPGLGIELDKDYMRSHVIEGYGG